MQHLAITQYQYNLPEDKIAKFPLQDREASKLLIYRDGEIEEDIFRNIASKFSESVLFVRNNTRVIQARLIFSSTENHRIEIFLLEPFNQSIEQALQNESGSIQFYCLIGNKRKWKEEKLTLKYNDVELKSSLGSCLHEPKGSSGSWGHEPRQQSNDAELQATIVKQIENEFIVELKWQSGKSFSDLIQTLGHTPLPPYLKRSDEVADKETYQTVYSTVEGSVAAPTAGLHFTASLIKELENQQHQFADLTLHVGAGTFKPVQVENVLAHEMHAEEIHVSLKSLQQIHEALLLRKKIVAVGTTSCRSLETLYGWGLQCINICLRDTVRQKKNTLASVREDTNQGNSEDTNQGDKVNEFFLTQFELYETEKNIEAAEAIEALISFMQKNNFNSIKGKTQLMIKPGFDFKIVDALITNFHQPASTLLLLVAAFIGDDWKKVYNYALENDFRFFSYGDASLLFGK